jgi:PadR family transcriptional regulator PadR
MDICKESWILEMYILAMLNESDNYGYELAKSNSLGISESTFYPILRRLHDDGCLESYSQTHDARLRRFYHITTEGQERFGQLKETWRKFRNAIDCFLMGTC